MRGLLLALVVLGAALTALPVAEAHVEHCETGDTACRAACTAPRLVKGGDGHACRWNVGPPP